MWLGKVSSQCLAFVYVYMVSPCGVGGGGCMCDVCFKE